MSSQQSLLVPIKHLVHESHADLLPKDEHLAHKLLVPSHLIVILVHIRVFTHSLLQSLPHRGPSHTHRLLHHLLLNNLLLPLQTRSHVSFLDLLQAVDLGTAVLLYTRGELADHSLLLLAVPPLVSGHVVEVEFTARVGFVAPDDHREEQAVINHHILKCDVPHGDAGLRLAGALGVEGVEHAAGAIAVGLFHLLRTDVDCPPMGSLHGNVLVPDILHHSIALVSRVGFDVDSFPRPLHLHILESDVSDAVGHLVRGNTPDSDSHPKYHSDVLNKHVLGAVSLEVSSSARFGHHNIVPVLHSHVVDVEVGAMRIDAVGVEWEHGNQSYQAKGFEKIELGRGIDLDVHVVDQTVFDLVQFQMELGRVLQDDVMEADVDALVNPNEVRPGAVIVHELLEVEQHDNPPVVASTVNGASSPDLQVVAVLEGQETHLLARSQVIPLETVFGGCQPSQNYQGDIIDVCCLHWQHVICPPGNNHFPDCVLRFVDSLECGVESLLVGELSPEMVCIGHSPELVDGDSD